MNSELFAACRPDQKLIVKRILLRKDISGEVIAIFHEQESDFWEGVGEEITYDGGYKPDADECLTCDAPDEARLLVNEMSKNATSIPEIDTKNFQNEKIKALFMESSENGSGKILIQQFTLREMLSRKIAYVIQGNVFRRLTDASFTLPNSLTCIIENDKLKFKSFHNLKTIFDMTSIYKEATEEDIRKFASHSTLFVGDPDSFYASTDQITRKLIYSIQKSNILGRYSKERIIQIASEEGFGINRTIDGKIRVPSKKKERKMFLSFLDDRVYKGPFTDERYMVGVGSRRQI